MNVCAKALPLLVFVCQSVNAQTGPAPIEIAVAQLSPSGLKAAQQLIGEANEQGGSISFRQTTLAPADFCARSRATPIAVLVAPLSTYRRCFPDAAALLALDVPLLPGQSTEVRRVLNGPLGAAVAEGMSKSGLLTFSLVEGETRIISSRAPIIAGADLAGKKILASGAPSPGRSLVDANRGSPVFMAAADNYAALERGVADGADIGLSTYAAGRFYEIQTNVLMSNHALDPIVVSANNSAFAELDFKKAGALEGWTSRLGWLLTLEQRAATATTLDSLRQRGVRITDLTAESSANFLTAGLRQSNLNTVAARLTTASPNVRTAGALQAAGNSVSQYWKVYFVTNRGYQDGKFLNAPGAALLYGEAEVEYTYDEPMSVTSVATGLVNYFQSGRGLLIDKSKVTATPFPVGFLNTRHATPSKAPIIYVHGFANTFDDAVKRAAWISWNSKRPVIAFSWPSQGRGTPGDYKLDAVTAEASTAALRVLLEAIGKDHAGETDVDIVAHSMGSKLLLGSLERMTAPSGGQAGPKFRQLALVAADIPAAKLEADLANLNRFFSRSSTLYVSDHDLALGISWKGMNPGEGPRAGLAPPVLVKQGLESIFIGPNDFSFTGHSYHAANGPIADDLVEMLRYGTPAQDRRGSIASPTGKGYFELRRIKSY